MAVTEPQEHDEGVPEAARAALARSRLAAQAAAGQAGSRAAQASRPVRRRGTPGAYSGPRPDERDPQTLASGWDRLQSDAGWSEAMRAGRLHELWPQIVGASVAEHTEIESFNPGDGALRLRASSTAWAESLRLLLPTIAATLDECLGVGVVTRIEVAGPAAPSWSHGRLRVRGRGPRDTYG